MSSLVRKWLWAALILASVALPQSVRAAYPFNQFTHQFTTDGTYTAWVSPESASPDSLSTIYANRIDAADPPIPLAINQPARLYNPAIGVIGQVSIDAGIAVWVEARGSANAIVARDLVHLTTPITLAEGDVSLPTIVGATITWWERAGGPVDTPAFLRSRQLHDPRIYTLTQVKNTQFPFHQTLASPNHIVWAQGTTTIRDSLCWQLSAIPAGGGTPQRVADQICGELAFDLVGSRLVFAPSPEDMPGNTSNGHTHLTYVDLFDHWVPRPGPEVSSDLTTDGRYVYWSVYRPRNDGFHTYDIYGFDPNTASVFAVLQQVVVPDAPEPALPQPHARNGWLTFIQHFQDHGVLSAITIDDTLPNSRFQGERIAYANGEPREIFAPTGHTLGGIFAAYREKNGGLSVFGYPLTEEFQQRNADTNDWFTVQYLERQRYEFHPELAGTPYVVLLGRLGAEALAQQGRNWQTLPHANPNSPHYFPQTGQAIAPEFWDYWRTHGLELGDPGMSEREALALWGYPLTSPTYEMVETGDLLLVQWFERARFEYHPQNPAPYRVLLARLAADRVDQFRWGSQ